MRKSIFVSFTLFQLIFVTPSTLNAGPFNAFWKWAGFSKDSIGSLVRSDICFFKKTNFKGCVNAVNKILEGLDPDLKLATPGVRGRLVKSFGILKIVKDEQAAMSASLLKHITAWRMKTDQYWKTIESDFSKLDDESVSFKIVIDWIFDPANGLIDPERDYELLAEGFNGYYSMAFDPYMHIFPSQTGLALFRQQTGIDPSEGKKIVGVGAHIIKLVDTVIVTSPVPGGPAEAAGILSGDQITHVDGETVRKLGIQQVFEKITGEEGTTVRLRIARRDEAFEVSIQRAEIETQDTVRTDILHINEIKVGYLKLDDFRLYPEDYSSTSDDPCFYKKNQLVVDGLNSLIAAGVEALILDLRNNPGGDVQIVSCIAGDFVGKNKVIMKLHPTTAAAGEETYLSQSEKVTDLPMVTLVNAASASGAEALSGALQDFKRSFVLGETTFGKGSVQRFSQWNLPTIQVKNTIGYYSIPSGRFVQQVGVKPDFEIYTVPNPTEEEKFRVREKLIYPDALSPRHVNWKNPRGREIRAATRCMKANGRADSVFREKSRKRQFVDYQLESALDLMSCIQ